jgi:hypothetical protein
MNKQDDKTQDQQALYKENLMLKEVLKRCLKARQINHVRQIIKEALNE